MEHQEALEPGALVSHPPDLVHRDLDLLLADGVVTPGVVVCGVLLASDQLLRMEELPVGSSSNLLKENNKNVVQ